MRYFTSIEPPPPLAGVDEELEEEHAARARAVATAAAPTVDDPLSASK